MADTPTERLCAPHRMLPVLLEQGVEPKGEGLRPLLEAIRGELRALIAAEDPIPEELLRQLLRRRRVVVLVDHFSEMPEATRQAIRPGHSEFPVNALIVTSRLEERLDSVPRTTVKPLRIQRDRLGPFMEAYLTQRNARDCFNDVEFFEACVRLSSMVGARDITVLLAKLYVEQMIAVKAGLTGSILPETIPDLMLNYVNEINRGVDPPKLEDRQVHRVAKVLAWECLKRTYRPTPAPRQAVLAALTGRAGRRGGAHISRNPAPADPDRRGGTQSHTIDARPAGGVPRRPLRCGDLWEQRWRLEGIFNPCRGTTRRSGNDKRVLARGARLLLGKRGKCEGARDHRRGTEYTRRDRDGGC